jgi:hypothetical protein
MALVKTYLAQKTHWIAVFQKKIKKTGIKQFFGNFFADSDRAYCMAQNFSSKYLHFDKKNAKKKHFCQIELSGRISPQL